MEHPLIFKVGKPTSASYDAREYLEVQLRQAEQWFYYAERHRRVASIILDAMAADYEQAERDRRTYARNQQPLDLNNQALMAMGFAIENLAKGALVHTTKPLLRKDDTLVGSLKHHDLHDLVMQLGLGRPAWVDFLRMCSVLVSGPDARYPARAKATGESMVGANYRLAKVWELFEELFEALALELLKRSNSEVRITLNQYERGEEDLCIRYCSHAEWIAWRLHGELPDWMPLPPPPQNPWR